MSDIPFTAKLALDAKPERTESVSNWYDDLIATLVGVVRTRLFTQQTNFSKFYQHLKTQLSLIKAMDDLEYTEFSTQLRYAMVRDGLLEEHIEQSFALTYKTIMRELKMRPYKVQLMAGWAMMHGKLAEMETGEGKTLAALFPACAAAMAKIPVHIVTANDYLAQRDAKQMLPVYQALGLSVGVITAETSEDARYTAYECDVVYCTSKQLAMDYLRDRMKQRLQNRVLRQQLQQQVDKSHSPRQLPLLHGLYYAIIDEADSVLIDDARVPLILASDQKEQVEQANYFQALMVARLLQQEQDFQIKPAEPRVRLTKAGEQHLAEIIKALPSAWPIDIAREFILLALRALYVLERDKHYLLKDDKIQLIDENTGRLTADRSWEISLQLMIECKEQCGTSDEKSTLARISFQRFFSRYLHIAGMSGTACEVAGELYRTYGLEVVRIPTRKPSRRKMLPERICLHSAIKWPICLKRITKIHNKGRPILIGTRTLKDSEYLSQLLKQAHLPHQLLNARQDENEANVIARAGEIGEITIATNIAGRGTDIRVMKESLKKGGLHIISMELNDAHRIDRQLYGRCARQGNRGSCEAIVSLDDSIFECIPHKVKIFLRRQFNKQPCLPIGLGRILIRWAQWTKKSEHARGRRMLLKWDRKQEQTLAFSGKRE